MRIELTDKEIETIVRALKVANSESIFNDFEINPIIFKLDKTKLLVPGPYENLDEHYEDGELKDILHKLQKSE